MDMTEPSIWDLSKAKVQRRVTRVVVILEPKAIGSSEFVILRYLFYWILQAFSLQNDVEAERCRNMLACFYIRGKVMCLHNDVQG